MKKYCYCLLFFFIIQLSIFQKDSNAFVPVALAVVWSGDLLTVTVGASAVTMTVQECALLIGLGLVTIQSKEIERSLIVVWSGMKNIGNEIVTILNSAFLKLSMLTSQVYQVSSGVMTLLQSWLQSTTTMHDGSEFNDNSVFNGVGLPLGLEFQLRGLEAWVKNACKNYDDDDLFGFAKSSENIQGTYINALKESEAQLISRFGKNVWDEIFPKERQRILSHWINTYVGHIYGHNNISEPCQQLLKLLFDGAAF